MATARQIIDQLSAALVATGAGLRPSAYRFALQDERAGGADRCFEMYLDRSSNQRGVFGAGVTSLTAELVVRVAYARLGGDAGGAAAGGDRRSVNSKAGEDSTLITDCLRDSRSWNATVTGVWEIRLLAAASKTVDGKLSEVFESRFRLEHSVDWP